MLWKLNLVRKVAGSSEVKFGSEVTGGSEVSSKVMQSHMTIYTGGKTPHIGIDTLSIEKLAMFLISLTGLINHRK